MPSIILGSENKAKLRAAQNVVDRLFPDVVVIGVKVPSGISDQPKSDEETMQGAINRAIAARAEQDADFGIGIEGGFHLVNGRYFECGWVAVAHRDGRVGIGSSARFELSKKIIEPILAGKELAEVIDELAGESDIRNNQGAMGIISAGHLPRDLAMTHGLFFAFGRFISDAKYWE